MQDDFMIFVAGNCQMHYLAAVLGVVFPGRVRIVGAPYYGQSPSFWGVTAPFIDADRARLDALSWHARGSRIIVLGQATPLGRRGIDQRTLGVRCESEQYVPHLEFYCPWPEQRGVKGRDARKLRRLYSYDIASLESSAKHSTLGKDMPQRVAEAIKTAPYFHSWNHPHGHLIAPYLTEIVNVFGGERIHKLYNPTLETLRTDAGISTIMAHPIPPHRLEVLGLDWGLGYLSWWKGREALGLGEVDRAVCELETALLGFPTNWKVRADLGEALLRGGDLARGIEMLDSSLRLPNPDNCPFVCQGLTLLLQRGMASDSVGQRARWALERHADAPGIHAVLSECYLREKRVLEAESHARQALNLAPDNDHFACLLGRILWTQERRTEAIQWLDEFVLRQPDARLAGAFADKYRAAEDLAIKTEPSPQVTRTD